MTFQTFDFFLLRLPTLPLLTQAAETKPEADTQLYHLWQTTSLAEAVYSASPVLSGEINAYLTGNGWPLPASLAQSLWKYAIRMSSRATPFGVMAGYALGTIAQETRVTLPSDNRFVRHHRIDMGLWPKLIHRIAIDPAVRQQLRFYPNNTLYRIRDEWRYTERQDTDQGSQYFISAVPASEPLLAALHSATDGATRSQLIEALQTTGLPADQASLYVEQLIDNQLLYSELDPCITSGELLGDLLQKLSSLPGTTALQDNLTALGNALNQPAATVQKVHQAIHACLQPLMAFQPLPSTILQTDQAIRTSTNQLNRQVVQTILHQMDELLPLNRPHVNRRLTAFVAQYRERYDQQELPLLSVLDGDVGIGYGDSSGGQAQYSPWIDELVIPAPTTSHQTTWGPYENLLLSKLSEALQNRQLSVELLPEELVPLRESNVPVALPHSFYVFGTILGSSPEAIDQGRFMFSVSAIQGPSAATLFGRFCAHSTHMTEQVRACLRREEQHRPDVIYAELVHWPDDRLGNILIRPRLRDYEIPYGSQASVEPAYQIPLSDLLVSVDSAGNVRLRSVRHNKEVIPRLTSAHNYRSGLSTYQFLADLQRQGGSMDLRWNWSILGERPFLPRITYRNLILSRAQWTLTNAALRGHSADELASHVCSTLGFPRWVALLDGDNELMLDLHSYMGKQLLHEEVKRRASVRVIEWLATQDQCWVRDQSGVFTSEVVFPCEWATTQTESSSSHSFLLRPTQFRSASTVPNSIIRSFPPGSEWLYVKLYAGESILDELLLAIIRPFMTESLLEQRIDNGFFVRYADPHPHIRLRMHLTDPSNGWKLLTKLTDVLAALHQVGAVYRIQTDTYEREIERYGAACMEASEYLFGYDSRAILDYLHTDSDPMTRWWFGVKSCDALLTDFGLSLDAKATLLEQLQAQFLAENRADKSLRKQLNQRYREDEPTLNDLLTSGHPSDPFHACDRIIQTRSRQLIPLVETINQRAVANSETPAWHDLLTSYLHMSLNRLFMSDQRTHELVIYHYLARYYASQRARMTKSCRAPIE